jgi:uncharacterized protein (TIGR03118 family)
MIIRRNRSFESARVEGLEGRLFFAAHPALVAQTNLISDQAGVALLQDPNLVNPWGVAFDPAGGELWVSQNGTGVSSLYNVSGTSTPVPLTPTVIIPGGGSTPTAAQPSNPTGQVFAGGTGFPVTENGVTMNSFFVFVGEDGAITGWNPSLDLNHAVVAVDNSASGAVYKGAALAPTSSGTSLFVANFNSGHIEVYDSSFNNVTPAGAFTDRAIPKTYAPFNVQNVGGQLYVTYARQNAAKHDDVAGAGHGFVDVFNTSGKLVRRLQRGGFLNSPWGVAVAPSSWGRLAGDILVGQFGNGRIDLFSPKNGVFLGLLRNNTGQIEAIDGLWALSPGNDGQAGDANTIYFTAGPDGEQHGLFGALQFTTTLVKQKVTTPGTTNPQSPPPPPAPPPPPPAPPAGWMY